MKINDLLFISNLFLFTLGLLLLFYVNETQHSIKSNELYKFIGDYVWVSGKIKNISFTKNNNTKLKICDEYGCFYVIVPESIKLKNNCSYIEAKGKLSYYYGEYYVFILKNKQIYCK